MNGLFAAAHESVVGAILPIVFVGIFAGQQPKPFGAFLTHNRPRESAGFTNFSPFLLIWCKPQ
jgi:hypothetical protein